LQSACGTIEVLNCGMAFEALGGQGGMRMVSVCLPEDNSRGNLCLIGSVARVAQGVRAGLLPCRVEVDIKICSMFMLSAPS